MKSVGRCRLRRSLALAVTCMLAATGCRDSGATDDPTISVPETTLPPGTTASTTPTTTLIPLDQDPPVIDLAYAQRVLDEISRLEGEASRILYRDKAVTPEYEALLQSFLQSQALDDARAETTQDLSVGFRHYEDPPGDPRFTARRLLSSKAGCITLLADSDFGPRFKNDVGVQKEIGIVLQRRKSPSEVERRLNPANWVETGAGPITPGRDLSELCR
jgi:hypothetical protein